MSKCRSMYAGSSGAVYNVNGMHPGNGNNKWQGLVSTTNMRSGIIPYVRTRADSDNRNVVFCMNQLGGVGRKSTMFATTADGVKLPCQGSGSTINTIFKFLQPNDSNNLNLITNNNELWVGSNLTAADNLTGLEQVYNFLVENKASLDEILKVTSFISIPVFSIPVNYDPGQFSFLQNNPSSNYPQLINFGYVGAGNKYMMPVDKYGFATSSDYSDPNTYPMSNGGNPSVFINPIKYDTLSYSLGPTAQMPVIYLPETTS